ncbi:hypothetical protein SAMN04489798_2165 [Pseudomonas arsenicoxydans]|uniref:Peptidase n=1 Tax=Pseudomonas arsenicoxydans TaxID=702115 RepID=A0A1H0H7E3_9PSED|nr:hypothetical protein [Pseudomonas arsenicoxydans]SDO15055.1 hypothetical protein SAMN04489798_2165 [Pseudomonas arsenicoxydans]
MGPKKPAVGLKRDLKDIADNLELVSGELSKLAERIDGVDITAVLNLMSMLYNDADKLRAYAAEVKEGRIVRARTELKSIR